MNWMDGYFLQPYVRNRPAIWGRWRLALSIYDVSNFFCHFRWWKPTGEGAHCHHPWQVPFLGPWKQCLVISEMQKLEVKVEGRFLLTDNKPIWVRYISLNHVCWRHRGIIPSDLRHRCWQSLISNNIYSMSIYRQGGFFYCCTFIFLSRFFWDMFHWMFEHIDLRKLSEYSSVASHQVHR